MTTEPNNGADSNAVSVTLDAVSSHLRRRAQFAEQEALMLAIAVRDLNGNFQASLVENTTLKQRIAELEGATNG